MKICRKILNELIKTFRLILLFPKTEERIEPLFIPSTIALPKDTPKLQTPQKKYPPPEHLYTVYPAPTASSVHIRGVGSPLSSPAARVSRKLRSKPRGPHP